MTLKRVLSAFDAGWIVAGSMIGAGIFFTPGVVSAQLPGVAWPLLAWLVGGLIALAGALVYGELGARIPEAGGDYQYLTAAFGPLWGFLNGWAAITLTFSAAAAAQTRAALAALPWIEDSSAPIVTVLAPFVVLVLTWANTVGSKVAGRTTAWFTAVPVAVVVGLFLVGLAGGRAEAFPMFETAVSSTRPSATTFAAALIPIFFAYSGWNAAAYLTAEMHDPQRGLARGLVGGTLFVIGVYLVFNLALFAVLPQQVIAGSERPAAEAAHRMLDTGGETLLTLMISIAILGSANVTLMAGARLYYAIAADGMAPRQLTRVSTAGVPSTALWIGGLWSAGLALVGSVSELVGWATLAILLLSSMTVLALFVLRRRDPTPAAYRCPGYPVTPALYFVVSLAIAVAAYRYDPQHALFGLVIIAAGFPLYFVAKRWFRKVA